MKMMLKKLVYRRPGRPHNFLMYPFLLIMAAYGFAFLLFDTSLPVTSTALYTLTLSQLDGVIVTVWGALALAVTVGNVVALIYRKRYIGVPVALAGFLLWAYAFCLDIVTGFWLQIFISAGPNMMFWGWYYLSQVKYHDFECKTTLD